MSDDWWPRGVENVTNEIISCVENEEKKQVLTDY